MDKKTDCLRHISLAQLEEQGCIYIDNIEEGFNEYQSEIIEGTKGELNTYLRQKIVTEGYQNSYVDFYYGRLTKDERQKAHQVLRADQISYLQRQSFDGEQIFFCLTEELFEIAFELSVTEMLFSTFYFSKTPCTVWSNFNHQLIVFTERLFA